MTHHLIHHHTQSGYQLFLNALRHHSHSHPLAFRQLSGIHTSSTSSPAPRWTLRSRTHHPTLIASTAALVLGGGYYAYLNLEHESGFLHPNHYSPCLLRSVERLSDDTSLFHVSVPVTQVPIPPHPLYIESVYVKHPDLQIERPYTPLDGIRRDGEAKTSLLIKRYSDGELSNYIHQQRPLELRGPCLSWIHPTGRVKEIVFVRIKRALGEHKSTQVKNWRSLWIVSTRSLAVLVSLLRFNFYVDCITTRPVAKVGLDSSWFMCLEHRRQSTYVTNSWVSPSVFLDR